MQSKTLLPRYFDIFFLITEENLLRAVPSLVRGKIENVEN